MDPYISAMFPGIHHGVNQQTLLGKWLTHEEWQNIRGFNLLIVQGEITMFDMAGPQWELVDWYLRPAPKRPTLIFYWVNSYELITWLAKLVLRIFSGWWLGHPSEKYDFVNWDDEIPNINGKIKLMFQTTNQSSIHFIFPVLPWTFKKSPSPQSHRKISPASYRS